MCQNPYLNFVIEVNFFYSFCLLCVSQCLLYIALMIDVFRHQDLFQWFHHIFNKFWLWQIYSVRFIYILNRPFNERVNKLHLYIASWLYKAHLFKFLILIYITELKRSGLWRVYFSQIQNKTMTKQRILFTKKKTKLRPHLDSWLDMTKKKTMWINICPEMAKKTKMWIDTRPEMTKMMTWNRCLLQSHFECENRTLLWTKLKVK